LFFETQLKAPLKKRHGPDQSSGNEGPRRVMKDKYKKKKKRKKEENEKLAGEKMSS